MDTRIATSLFELMLPGVWTRATPEPGLTVFRGSSGTEQLSISSFATREPVPDNDQRGKLLEVMRARRDAESRLAPASTVSGRTYLVAPRATFTAADATLGRRSATVILAREAGFVVLYLESVGGKRRRSTILRHACLVPARRRRAALSRRRREGCRRPAVNVRPFKNGSLRSRAAPRGLGRSSAGT